MKIDTIYGYDAQTSFNRILQLLKVCIIQSNSTGRIKLQVARKRRVILSRDQRIHPSPPNWAKCEPVPRGYTWIFYGYSISLEYLDASTVALLRRGGRGVYEMPFSSTYSISFFMLPSLAEIHMLLLIFFPISLYFSPKDRVKINMLHTSIR